MNEKEKTSSNSQAPRGATLGPLLRWHLRMGTRPRGRLGRLERAWTAKSFADATGVHDKSVRNWLRDETVPADLETIETALFGDASGRYSEEYLDACTELRNAHERTRLLLRGGLTGDTLPYVRECSVELERYLEAVSRYAGSTYRSLRLADLPFNDFYVPQRGRSSHNRTTESLFETIRKVFETKQKHIVVEGPPGSGKSTLLRAIAVNAWSNPRQIGLDQPYIVLPVRLRALSEVASISREERILQAIERAGDIEIRGTRPQAGFLEVWPLQSGSPILLLLDGFDEVEPERRSEAVAWLEQLKSDGVPFVLASRPTQELREFDDNADRIEILPLSVEERIELITKWVGSAAQDFMAAYTKLSAGELAGTPMLLTIAASIFKKNGALPGNRSELYKVFVKDSWTEGLRRGGKDELETALRDDADVVIPLALEAIAHEMTSNRSETSLMDFVSDQARLCKAVADMLEKEFELSPKAAARRAPKLLGVVGTRAGVFVSDGSQCEWLHPTFREYLTGAYFVHSSDAGEMRKAIARCTDPAWTQVVLFAVGLLVEERSIIDELKAIAHAKPPGSLIVAADAFRVDRSRNAAFGDDLVSMLCDAVISNARGNVCERYLTSGSERDALKDALKQFMGQERHTHTFNRFETALIDEAIAYGSRQSSAIEDLAEMGLLDPLEQLSQESKASASVRVGAVCQLFEVSSKRGIEAFIKMARDARNSRTLWQELSKSIGMLANAKIILAMCEADAFPDHQFGSVLDALPEATKPDVLDALVAGKGLNDWHKVQFTARFSHDWNELMALLSNTQPGTAVEQVCIATLASLGGEDRLLEVVLDDSKARITRQRALRALAGAEDQLARAFRDQVQPHSIRRRAAEGLYKLSNSQHFAELRAYFSSLRIAHRRHIVFRLAVLSYLLDLYGPAATLFETYHQKGDGTNASFRIYGHCLQKLDREGQAVEAYSRAIEIGADDIFAYCQRAVLKNQQGDAMGAAEDVRHVGVYRSPIWFRAVAADLLLAGGDYEQATQWLDWEIRQETQNLFEALLKRGIVAFRQGAFADAKVCFGRANDVRDSAESGVEQSCNLGLDTAITLRAIGLIDDAIDAFEWVRENGLDDGFVSGLLVEALIEAGRFAEAQAIYDEDATTDVSDPYSTYLNGLLRASIENDVGQLRAFAKAALEQLNSPAHYGSIFGISNRILFCFASGDDASALDAIPPLVARGDGDQLRNFTIPYLKSLQRFLPATSQIAQACNDLLLVAWPDGIQHGDPVPRVLKMIRRDKYPFPIYCQRGYIEGLHEDIRLGEQILGDDDGFGRAIVLWTVGQDDRVFGYCNFKKSRDDEYHFKFCDLTSTVVSRNLKIFVDEMQVRRLLFPEMFLLERFKEAAFEARLQVECAHVALPAI
jgi:tetratricopeptide (TPR) repeat protein